MRALVTGAGVRIGRHIALALAEDGHSVAIHYNRSAAPAEEVADLIRANGGTAATLRADLRDPDACRALVPAAAKALAADGGDGPLDLLVNNASTFVADSADAISAFALNMDVNLRAPLLLSEAFAQQAEAGVILHMIDQRVEKPNPLYFSYTLSKAALHWAVKTQAQAFAPHVRVVGIGPGPTLRNTDQADGEFEREAAATLLGHGSPPEEIIRAVRFLVGASAVTGQMITVDGGQHLTWQTPDLLTSEPET